MSNSLSEQEEMKNNKEQMPTPKELEKEISEFLSKRFGENVKLMPPLVMAQPDSSEDDTPRPETEQKIAFDLKPEDLIAYLDHYIIKQDQAKAVLATKICTHFNRIKRFQSNDDGPVPEMVGQIKNNVLMMGPTGVGKTYMVKLIAKRIGVPFVKGDATKFSETGYVGGDIEDLVRDLVREADGDLEAAQYGIIYIDEIDKIASSRNMIGADVSRTGVQRALLKPMEETDVDMKVPHDPITMLQEIERFRKTGKRDRSSVNTKHILFIMSGAFQELPGIISKRMNTQQIGFGGNVGKAKEESDWLKHAQSEDLVAYGFESEFVGRLPVRAVFERLGEEDLFNILKNPSNPIVLGKKLDFSAYGIDIKFDDALLESMAKAAYLENTGARGLVSAVENVLLPFEKKLPSLNTRVFPATEAVLTDADGVLGSFVKDPGSSERVEAYEQLSRKERAYVAEYLSGNWDRWADQYHLSLTPARATAIADYYSRGVMEIGMAIGAIKSFHEKIKALELEFFKNHEINIILEEETVDYLMGKLGGGDMTVEGIYRKLTDDFKHGLQLVLEKTGKNRFFISKKALLAPEEYLDTLIRDELRQLP
jgi:endopeptidase Clp ATP-binding regulatory subunit ClpX